MTKDEGAFVALAIEEALKPILNALREGRASGTASQRCFVEDCYDDGRFVGVVTIGRKVSVDIDTGFDHLSLVLTSGEQSDRRAV